MSRRATALLSALLIAALVPVAIDRAPSAKASGDAVLLAAGDVASCVKDNDEATARLLANEPNATVAMLGDGTYPGGSLPNYQNCYGHGPGDSRPAWGDPGVKARTKAVPGNHEYEGASPQAVDYFDYFGEAAGPNRLKGWYSFDPTPGWHVIALNANCTSGATDGALDGCDEGSEQWEWLKGDLARNSTSCMIAMWHQPRFFSVVLPQNPASDPGLQPSSDSNMNTLWKMLQTAGVDLVLSAHWHAYERFPRLSLPPGRAAGPGVKDENGMREIIVGTGGGSHHYFLRDTSGAPTRNDPNAERQIDGEFGVVRLGLHPTGYDWSFVSAGRPAVNGDPSTAVKPGTVRDSGTDGCGPGAPTPPVTDTTPDTTVTPPPPTSPPTSVGGPAPSDPPARSGYWMAGADGKVYPFGAAQGLGDAAPSAGAEAVDIEPTPTGDGYWLADSAGIVAARGRAPDLGSVAAGRLSPGEKATSLSATPSGKGYWLFTNRGRVFTAGDALPYGDMSKVTLNGPVLDSIPTPTGHGYYMVASDGGIFAFGDAAFRGSMGGKRLNAPVQSLVPVPSGGGYWLVAADGGVFAFGAPFRGSMGGTKLARPVTGMVPYGNGYLMVGEDGGIFAFSDKDFAGSLGDHPPARPIVSVAVR